MAITDYASLQASVANWLHRSDLTSVIPDLVAMAESRINRTLKMRVMETEVPLPFAAGDRAVQLPTGFIEPLAVWYAPNATTPRTALLFKLPQDIPVSVASAMPRYWTVDGGNVALDAPLADGSYIITMRYRQSFALSASSPTNWLLTNHPDLYLFGALLESAPFIKDDDRTVLWQDRFDRALNEIQNKEGWSRSMSSLSTEAASLSGRSSSFNILGG